MADNFTGENVIDSDIQQQYARDFRNDKQSSSALPINEVGNEDSKDENFNIKRAFDQDTNSKRKNQTAAKVQESMSDVEKIEKTEETLKKLKLIYRAINGTSAASVWGIIITYLVMNLQLFFGNMMKVRKMTGLPIPELSWPEILLLGLLNIIVVFAVALLMFAVYFVFEMIIGTSPLS